MNRNKPPGRRRRAAVLVASSLCVHQLAPASVGCLTTCRAAVDAPAKGKWQREPVYYVDDYQQRRGCGCFSFGFSAAGVLLLLILLLLAQLAS